MRWSRKHFNKRKNYARLNEEDSVDFEEEKEEPFEQ